MTRRFNIKGWAPLRRVCAALLLLCGVEAASAKTRPGALPDLRIATGTGNIVEAWFAQPTTRYQHFVLGARYEAASLFARLRDGRTVQLTLSDEWVFEDRQPRLADLDGDGSDEIIVVRSHRDRGAALTIVGIVDNRLDVIAETPPTGRRNTWLNPAGIADFDGDGRLDIAYVQMPHVLGTLRLWTLTAGRLVERGSLEGFSNHVAGSSQLNLSAVADFNGDGVADLALPSLDRQWLRFVTFKGGVRELKRLPLRGRARSDFTVTRSEAYPIVMVGLGDGQSQPVDYRNIAP